MIQISSRVIALLMFFGAGVCAQYDQCTGNISWIGDAWCDDGNNNAGCGYDGGDCCYCSCDDGPDYSCGVVGFDCRDSEYIGEEISNCNEESAVGAPCSPDTSTPFVVNDTASATALADAIRCSEGAFDVKWLGHVVVNRTINVANGTVLYVAGVGSEAEMQAAPGIRLLTVINASIELRNIKLAGGYATFGGAIAAAGSNLSFESTSFTGNSAIFEGGALYATFGSTAFFGEGIHLDGNHAGVKGGALNVVGASKVIFHGYTSFSNCTTNGNGGALYVSSSKMSWVGDTVFSDNMANEIGGALYVASSTMSWLGDATFSSNTASKWGGGLYISSSNLSWSGEGIFSDNIAHEWGGGLYVISSDMSWTGDANFSDNTADLGGGALYVTSSNITWASDPAFSGNTANNWGGALFISSSHVFWKGDAIFSDNTANIWGGALHVWESNILWAGDTLFSDNTVNELGGALSIAYSRVSWTGAATFSSNTAGQLGGALHGFSSDLFWAGDAIFSDNKANEDGGALYIADSIVSWSGAATFSSNTAGQLGGALYGVFSDLFWAGYAIFSGNTGFEWGGALSVWDSNILLAGDTLFSDSTSLDGGGALFAFESSVFWSGSALFFGNNADRSGGALLLFSSHVICKGNAFFSNNTATEHGGAIFVGSSTVSWEGNLTFFHNIAEQDGGALFVTESNVSWVGNILFSDNNAHEMGGAIQFTSCDVSLTGDAIFFDNTANKHGAALSVFDSRMSWAGHASISNNTADRWAGAMFVWNSTVSWTGDVVFSDNNANGYDGGALVVETSNVTWKTRPRFFNNAAARNGGALSILNGGRVVLELGGEFVRNSAFSNGGAVIVFSNDDDEQASSIWVSDSTTFLENQCGGDGGALAIVADGMASFATTNVTFYQNSAHTAGGAVAVKGSVVGPQFNGLTFISNDAQIGGAAYITSSGTATTEDRSGVSMQNPTTFNRCIFIGNKAGATGGAIDSGAGLDVITNSNFARNIARAGGALKLAGITSLTNCTFTENTSENDEGSAVANFGFVSSVTECSFVDNTFMCDPGEFLDYHETNAWNGVFDVVCKGCAECDDCTTSRRIPACSEELDHTKSTGGNATIEALEIDRGYWRATNTSRKVMECYNADACLGGVTGASNYCSAGYEGPYCSICRDGFSPGLRFTCNKCSGGIGSVIVAIIIATSTILVVVLLLRCLMRSKATGEGRVLLASWRRRLLSLKIIVIVWQITTQFASVANVRYPDLYQRFLDVVNILNFDVNWILSAECIIDLNFHHRLITSTLGPPVALAVFGSIYAIYWRIKRPPYHDFLVDVPREVRLNFTSVVLLLTFLVYSSVSSTLFQMFACDELDDGKRYLLADYRIDCDSPTHRSLQVYAACMMLVYTAGIPVLYGTLLYRNRQVLMDENVREEDAAAKSTYNLWKLYKPNRFYYELVECSRRILLAGVVVFILPNTAAQVAIALMIATFFMVLSEMVAPYESLWDSWVSRIGHAIVFGSIYLGLLIKIDVSNERGGSQRVFEVVLIGGQCSMLLLVVVEVVVVTCQWVKRSS